MEKNIPIYFDTIILDSPIPEIPYGDSNAYRLQVGVFTKYRNRNGSYITDEYADYLIRSATRGNVPVIGFFDPETQKWASHTGPTLANGYGYVENFVGWQTFKDTDNVEREYAVFSVILFTQYYEEAKKIRGQHQSMELDPETITGDWASFEDGEYFVYKTGDMLGFCVIGEHEPCFSVSSFFSKNDEEYKSQYQKFSSLLQGLRQQIEETENKLKGGEQTMDEFEKNQTAVEPEVAPEVEKVEPEVEPEVEFSAAPEAESTVEPEAKPEVEPVPEVELEEKPEDEPKEPSEFEKLQQQFDELTNNYNELLNNFNTANDRIKELENAQNAANEELEQLRNTNTELQSSIDKYAAQAAEEESNKKDSLIKNYEKFLSEEEINPIKDMVKDFSYSELESKLAVLFANKQMAGSEEFKKVPLPEPEEENEFALLMKKYRK